MEVDQKLVTSEKQRGSNKLFEGKIFFYYEENSFYNSIPYTGSC